MNEFKKGQRVHVELDGVVTYVYNSTEGVRVEDEDGVVTVVNVKWVTAAEPYNWPPQTGDIWSTIDGENGSETEWFARRARDSDCLILMGDCTSATFAEDVLKLNPTLIRRRYKEPAPQLISDTWDERPRKLPL